VIAHQDKYAVLSCNELYKFLSKISYMHFKIIYFSFVAKWEKKNDKEVRKYYVTYPISNTSDGVG
jgi:hypothetical protein